MKEQRKHLTDCVVCYSVGGGSVVGTECHKRDTEVDQEHTISRETQAAGYYRKQTTLTWTIIITPRAYARGKAKYRCH